MLRLLRKGLANHNQQFLNIIYGCVAAHILLLFAACFIKSDDALHINLSVSPGARVVCVPSFMASRAVPQLKSARKNSRKSKGREKVSEKKQKKKNQTKSATALEPRANQQKTKKSKNKIAHKEKIAEKKVEVKNEEVQPAVPEQKKDTAIPATEVDDVVYVNKETYQLFEIAQQLQEAIGHQWSPPGGMPQGLECQVRITISAQGKATALEVIKKSGVAVFDMAARTALLKVEYPASVRGKTIVVDFNEEFL